MAGIKIVFIAIFFTLAHFNYVAGKSGFHPTQQEQFIILNTIGELRSLSQTNINALLNKKYAGVLLQGYYEKGDTPGPIVYKVTATALSDDNGAIIAVKRITLYHDFGDVCDMSYYGLRAGINSAQIADFNTKIINTALQKFKKITIKRKGAYYFRGNRGGEGGSYFRHKDLKHGTFWAQVGDGGGQPGGILIPSDRVFEMAADVELRQRATFMQAYNLITMSGVNNVVIRGGKIVGDLDNHNNRDGGEWGYGISIQGANNVLIENLEVTKLWADGINISVDVFNKFKESSNITFKNVKSTFNRRQGMSICGGRNLRFENCLFASTGVTQYTAPGFGVDLENDIHDVKLDNVTFNNCVFEKNYGGVRTVHNGKDATNINFISCIFRNNRTVNYDSFSAGGITFQNCDFGFTANHPYGFELRSSFDINFLKCTFSNGVYLGKRDVNSPNSRNIKIDGCTIKVKKDASRFFTFNDAKNVSVVNNSIIQEDISKIDLKKKWSAEAGKSFNFNGNRFK